MTAAKQIELVSVEDYLARELVSDVKHEYTGGYVYAMAGARTLHNRIAGAFFGAMYSRLRGRPCEPFNSDMKVRVKMPTHTRFYYPDGMVVCAPNPAGDVFQDRPVVIAEVVSDATRRIDEGEKRDAYLTIPTLGHYLIVDTKSPRVVVYSRDERNGGFGVRIFDGLEAVISLDAVGAQLPLAELYERVDFAEAEADAELDAE